MSMLAHKYEEVQNALLTASPPTACPKTLAASFSEGMESSRYYLRKINWLTQS